MHTYLDGLLYKLTALSVMLATSVSAENLSLDDALARALEHNLDIQISEVVADRALDQIDIAIAEFDPSLFFDAGIGESLTPARISPEEGVSFDQQYSQTWSGDASVEQKISVGTNFRIGSRIDQRETNSFVPEYNSRLFLSIEQPLLRGAGRKVNLTPRLLAESRSEQALFDYRSDALDILRDTELSYWQLAYEYARRDLRQSGIDAAQKLLEETEERERVGVATKVDVLQARASLASRLESVILANEAIARTQDDLAEIVGWVELADKDLVVAKMPSDLEAAPEREHFIESSMVFSLDRRAQLEVIRQSRLELARAKNLRRPELNLRFDGSYLGRDMTGSDAYRGAFDRDGYSWRGGLELSLPWGFRAAKARERQARRDLRTAELDEAKLEQSLFYELRGAWRDLDTGQKRLEVAEIAVRLQSEQFSEEEARYSAGLVTLREVLEAQEDWDAAQLSYLDALIDTLQAQVVISRLDGTLMDRHQLIWPDL